MKKIFSMCLMSMAFATMVAQTQDLPFTVSPEPGLTLEQIESVTLTLNSDYEEFEVNDNSAIYFNFNGDEFCGVNAKASGTTMVIKPNLPILQYGDYELVISAGAISWYGDYNGDEYTLTGTNEMDLIYSYTIGFGGDEPEPVIGEYPFFVDPTPGSVIESLEMITLTLDIFEGDYMWMDIEIPEDLYVMRNGEQLPVGISVEPEDGERLYLILDTPITESGDYEVVIPAGAMLYMDELEQFDSNEEAIVLNYTVGNEVVGPTEPPFNVSPAPGSEVDSLEAVILTVTKPEEGYEYFEYEDGFDFYFNRNGEHFCGTMATDSEDFFSVIITPSEPITEAGEYELVIPAWTLACTNDNYEPFYVNEEDLIYKYTVTGVDQPVGPVVYDVVPTSYKPANESTVDLMSRQFDSIEIFFSSTDISPRKGATVEIIPVGYEEEAFETSNLRAISAMKKILVGFGEVAEIDPDNEVYEGIEYNGTYEIIIPKGTFGDEAWISDPETGHSNEEIILTYEVVGGIDRVSNVSYTLEPEITWTNDLKTFTLTFPEGTSMYGAAAATLECIEAKYVEYAEFTDNGDSTFTLEFNTIPTETGKYTFTVFEREFGDAEFIETDGESGITNPEIKKLIDVTPTGIQIISSDNVRSAVYNLFGVKVSESIDNLPAGIYIVGGKKVVVK